MSFIGGRGPQRQLRWTRRHAVSILLFIAFWVLATIGQQWSDLLAWLLIIAAVIRIVLWVRLRWSGWRRPRPLRAKSDAATDGFVLGNDADNRDIPVSIGQLAAHGLILGATGSGKTTSLLRILCEEIVQGRPVVAIDMKGSGSFIAQLQAACDSVGRPFVCWRPHGPAHWNPLANGDATELKDKLLSAETFTEPHYQRQAERYLQTAIQVLQQVRPDRPVTLNAVTALLEPGKLRTALSRAPEPMRQRVGPYLKDLTRDQKSAILGMQARLAIVAESSMGEFLQPGEPSIDLRRALTSSNEVVCSSLNSSRYGKTAAQLAAMVIQDLTTVSGYRLEQPYRPLALVAIDEFSALDADNLLAMLARAREAGISVLLSTQELADLDRLADGFKDQVLGNTALTLAHRQNVPDSAELIAKMIGTETVWKHTYQTGPTTFSAALLGGRDSVTGMGTKREVEEFRVHPNTIKELPTGVAVLITRVPKTSATVLRVHPWQPPARQPR